MGPINPGGRSRYEKGPGRAVLTRQAVALPVTFHPVGGIKLSPLLSQLLHELETPNLADG